MKQLVIILFCLFSFCVSAAESPINMARADFKKTNETYKKLNSFSVETYYMVFEEHNAGNLIEAHNGLFMKNNTDYYTKIIGIETIKTNTKLINVVTEDKLIVVGDYNEVDFNMVQFNLDSIIEMCSDIKVQNLNTNERKYLLRFDELVGSEYNQIEVTIDIKNYRFTKIAFNYTTAMNLKGDFYGPEKQPRLEIIYKNFKPSLANPKIFKESNYIITENKKLKPTAKYSDYKVIDQRNETRFKK